MATDIIARGMITEYKSGTNISFTENEDGSVTISASGDVSSEDTVARETIDNHKLDKNNPHNVTAEQVGLGNVDNTSDLDKPISTAIQTALDDKADKTTATKDSNGLMSAADKAKLDGIEENANHTVIDSELSDTSENAIQNRAVAKAVKGGNSLSGTTSYTITDSVEYPLVGLKVFGKSTQDGTPTPENPVEIVSVVEPTVKVCGKNLLNYPYEHTTKVENGVSFTDNGDGSITIKGTATSDTWFHLMRYNLGNLWWSSSYILAPYIFSGVPNNVLIEYMPLQKLTMITIKSGVSVDATIYPLVEIGDKATSWEQPKKKLSITLPDTLNAIPVSSGGNVTIDGQEYIADYKDYGTGKYHKLIDPDKLDPTVSIVDNLDLLLASEEITDIPETEMQAYRQLQTYNGTTNIINDKGAGLSVEYCTSKMLAEYALPLIKDLEAENAKKDEEISVLKTDILNNEKIHNRIYEGVNLSEKFASEIAASPYNSDAWTWIKARITAEDFTGIRVGDYIPFTTTNGITLNAQIAGINTYKNYGDTPVGAHIDFICKELWGTLHPVNKVDYNNGTTNQNHSWLASDLYLYLNSLSGSVPNGTTVNPETIEVDYTTDGVYYYLPDALKSVIKEKRFLLPKRYSASGLLTDDNQWGWTNIGKLWLPDECEVYGTPMWGGNGFSAGGSGLQYPLFAGNMNRLKFRNGNRNPWWLLSPYSGDSSGWCIVHYNGYCSNYAASDGNIAVPVCFRV